MPHWNNAHGRSALTGGGRPLRPPTSDAQVYVLSTDQQPLNRLRLLAPEPSSARPWLFETLFRFAATGPAFDHFVMRPNSFASSGDRNLWRRTPAATVSSA